MEPGELSEVCMLCGCMLCREDCLKCDVCGDRPVIDCLEFKAPGGPPALPTGQAGGEAGIAA